LLFLAIWKIKEGKPTYQQQYQSRGTDNLGLDGPIFEMMVGFYWHGMMDIRCLLRC
jgi:hypothetical protein